MKIKLFIFLQITGFYLFSLQAQNKAFEINQKLGRGINLGNALESPKGTYGLYLHEKYFNLIAEIGFNSVRIPARWSDYALEEPPYTIDTAFINKVQWAVDQALSNSLMAVVNIHHYLELFELPAIHKNRLLGIWKQIAIHFKDYPDSLLFELCNEPNTNFTPQLWNAYAKEILDTVRNINPNRTIVIGTAEWGGIGALDKLVLPNDTNIILTVHYYNPFDFTHQGASWVDGSDAWLGITWDSTETQMNNIINDLNIILSYVDTANVPVYMGEFGAYSTAEMDSRAKWTAFCARKFEEFGFSWSYWEFGAGFGIFDPGSTSWRIELVKALVETTPTEYLPLTGDTILISNFEFGPGNWGINLNGTAAVNIIPENEMYHIEITDGSDQNWHVQMSKYQLPIIYKTTYKVIFDAYSPEKLTISPYVGRNAEPWNSYSGFNTITLSDTFTNYSFIFTMNDITDIATRLSIDMGLQTGNIYFDNFLVEIIEKTNPITSISIYTETGLTIINEKEGNLQLYVDLSPNTLSSSDVTWTIESGSGIAKINNYGLLTANGTGDGLVIVAAKSKFDPEIQDEIEISIKNQKTDVQNNSINNYIIYPNPVINILYIEPIDKINQFNIKIFNLLGNEINLPIEIIQNKVKINTSGLKNGIYFIKINGITLSSTLIKIE